MHEVLHSCGCARDSRTNAYHQGGLDARNRRCRATGFSSITPAGLPNHGGRGVSLARVVSGGIYTRHFWIAVDVHWCFDGRFSRVADPISGTTATPACYWWRRRHLVGSPPLGGFRNARRTVHGASLSAGLYSLRWRSGVAGNPLPFNRRPESART